LVAYREFSNITDELVRELRQTHQLKVVAGIESFTKRSAVRNVKNTAGLDKEELGIIYDKFYNVLYYKNHQSKQRMELEAFETFIGSIASWSKIDAHEEERQVKVAKNFFQRLFGVFDVQSNHNLSLQVRGRIKREKLYC
jgi:hypothetical protein